MGLEKRLSIILKYSVECDLSASLSIALSATAAFQVAAAADFGFSAFTVP